MHISIDNSMNININTTPGTLDLLDPAVGFQSFNRDPSGVAGGDHLERGFRRIEVAPPPRPFRALERAAERDATSSIRAIFAWLATVATREAWRLDRLERALVVPTLAVPDAAFFSAVA